VKTHQAFRFELDPADVTSSALASHAGGARFAHGWGLALVKSRLDQAARITERALAEGATAREAEALARTVRVPWSLASLRREWNQAKARVAPWWAENSKECYNSGLDSLARALDAWLKSRRGERKGPKMGFPQPKGKRSRRSFRITTGAFGVIDERHIRLPRIGVIRTKEPTAKLLRQLGAGTARILSATVSQTAGRWYVSFGCEVQREQPEHNKASGQVVGVDIGVSALAVLSTGEMVPNPKHLSRYQRRITRRQHELSRRHGPEKGRPPSKRWAGSKGRLARLHARSARSRADGLHKLTTRLAKSYPVVVVEDLNVSGMTASAKGSGYWHAKAGLNRAILDVAPGELRRQLGYKCSWYGSALVEAGRWYPSSKICSGCGWRKPSLPLSERTFICEACGLVIDRDLNAALNLAALVRAEVTGTASSSGNRPAKCSAYAQGEERSMGSVSPRCSSVNCEDGTGRKSRLDRTVTAARQRVAPDPVLIIGSDR
jgi:putative transposase